jgi:hypothetical protein
VTDMPNDPWFSCLPPCQTQVPCGQGWHAVRWEAGALLLPEHPDAEGELVLAALGGEKAGCIELAQAWERHIDDLSLLAIGPRGAVNETAVTWADVKDAAEVTPQGRRGRPRLRPMQLASPPSVSAGVTARQQQAEQELEQARIRRQDMLSLLALGYDFQVRLAGHVTAAHADQLTARVRPPLVTALTGRLALVAEQWLGIDPGQVAATLHQGAGWGQVELTGRGGERRLQVSLPAWWLARVWACGLSLVSGHLVVAVEQAGWPHARVLALRAPGTEPVRLDVHDRDTSEPDARTGGQGNAGNARHWEV